LIGQARLRIAVYHNLPSGGAKRSLCETVRRLAARHMVDVFSLSSANHDFADLRPHVARHEVLPFQPRPLLRSPFGRTNPLIRVADLRRVAALCRRIAQETNQGGSDVALVHPCQYEVAPSLLRSLNGVPTVYFCQEPPRLFYEAMPARPYDRAHSRRRVFLDRFDPLPGYYRQTLANNDRRNTRSAQRVLVNSRFMQTLVGPIYGITPHVSYLGVDTDWLHPGEAAREPFVLSVGSLTPLKGFDFLIEALAQIPSVHRPRLVIASNFQNPPERAYLSALAEASNVALTLAGNVDDATLASLYRQARVVAYAPVREPFGLVALEAMASGTPVVAVAEGGIPETVTHEQTGLLAPRDQAAFADALMRLYSDPTLATAYGCNGRERALKHWTWDRAAVTLERHLIETHRVPTAVMREATI
jgi:glycosyltransferase involved in cell wall biosynthesis